MIKFFRYGNGRVYIQMNLTKPKRVAVSAGGSVAWQAGEWHHVVAAWRGAASPDTDVVAAVYIDGKCVAWDRKRGSLGPLGRRFWIGSDARGRDSFEGAIDCLRIHQSALVSLDRPERLETRRSTPGDDPDLPDTQFLPPHVKPDPYHDLDTVRSTRWIGIPAEMMRRVFGDSPTERVIYRDSVTGAEVWMLTRSTAGESVAYTNYFPFNANGSLVRVWGRGSLCMRSDGSQMKTFGDLMPRDFSGLPQWHKTDPEVVLCRTTNGGRFEFNLKTKERRDLFIPDDLVPANTDIQFSDDGKHSMFITRQGAKRPFWFFLGDSQGKNRREVEIKSISAKPEADRRGSAAFLRDQHGRLYARYSLNKGQPRTGPTPYQNWLVDLDGKQFRLMDSHNNLLDGTPLHFVPAGTYVVTGHGGYSPSKKHFVHHRGKSGYKWIRDLATWQQRDLARIPGCDHMDWTVDDNWFFVWANQRGLPIYKCYVDTGVTHRIVATNSCPHAYGSCPYHGSSPDGTKLLYKSGMMGNLDLYLAIVCHPAPPERVRVRREGRAAVVEWEAPRAKEVAAVNVYRSEKTGRGYIRLNETPVTGRVFRDPSPPRQAYYAVTSVEHCGLEGRVFSNEAALAESEMTSQYVEAEAGTLTYPMREVFRPAGCSDNHAIARAVRDPVWQPAKGTGRAQWTMRVTVPGTYRLWARARKTLSNASGLSMAANGQPLDPAAGLSTGWTWIAWGSAMKLDGAPLAISAAVDGPGIELDKWLLTSDLSFTPRGMGNAPTQPPEPVADLSAKWDQDTGLILLRWTPSQSRGFHHYQVYRGDVDGFPPTQRRLLGSPTVAAYIDPGPFSHERTCYRVVAVDSWGHASAPSRTAVVQMPPRPPALDLKVQAEGGQVSDGAIVATDPLAEGRRCVVFGVPDEVPEYAGKLAVTADLPPGQYSVWLRVKGGPVKWAAFFWARLGDTEHYSRMPVARWTQSQTWHWERVTFLKSVRDPQEKPMTYAVAKRPTTLTLRHRANYLAVDCAFITSDPLATPTPDADALHPGCSRAFKRGSRGQ